MLRGWERSSPHRAGTAGAAAEADLIHVSPLVKHGSNLIAGVAEGDWCMVNRNQPDQTFADEIQSLQPMCHRLPNCCKPSWQWVRSGVLNPWPTGQMRLLLTCHPNVNVACRVAQGPSPGAQEWVEAAQGYRDPISCMWGWVEPAWFRSRHAGPILGGEVKI